MDAELLTWIFLIGGILLMLLELMLPGGVALFLGFSGVTVGILRFFGLLATPTAAITAWLIFSIALTLLIRPVLRKYFKSETFTKLADEDYEAMGQLVEVVETVTDTDSSGRIRFDGSLWRAKSVQGTIQPGRKATIQHRENTTWIIQAEGAQEPATDSIKTNLKN
ncbi:MAG: NfeD family protein [Balneolaceae bacterium]